MSSAGREASYAGSSPATALLTSPAFLLAVALLLLNDWVLKPAFGSWLTGKLSDFAGLAAFAIFWAAVLPRWRRAVFVLAGAGFVVWKSPLGDPVLTAWNALAVWPLERVVDYSDWLALGVLVPTYRLVRRVEQKRSVRPDRLARRAGALAIAGVAVVAFGATSIRRPTPIAGPEYMVPAAQDEVLLGLDSIGLSMPDRPSDRPSSGADTVAVHIRQPPERWVTVTLEVREVRSGETRIRLIAMMPQGPAPSIDALRRAILVQVVQPLHEWVERRRAGGR